ncbi:MAG: Bax inhibitor-1/YccA family protein [Planctomycetota bacterium]
MVANRTQSIGHAATAAVPDSVYYANSEVRIQFLRKVYTLLSLSMVVWMGTTLFVAFNETMLERLFTIFSGGILTLVLFVAAQFALLRVTAAAGNTISLLGLGLYSILMGIMTGPLVYTALAQGNEEAMSALAQGRIYTDTLTLGTGIVTQAFALTSAVFGGLSFYALTTKRDFSWMRAGLWMGFLGLFAMGALAMMGIGESLIGWGYSAAWVILMGGFILYDTQNIMRRFPADKAPIAAAMLLFDFILMFKHILILLMNRD